MGVGVPVGDGDTVDVAVCEGRSALRAAEAVDERDGVWLPLTVLVGVGVPVGDGDTVEVVDASATARGPPQHTRPTPRSQLSVRGGGGDVDGVGEGGAVRPRYLDAHSAGGMSAGGGGGG